MEGDEKVIDEYGRSIVGLVYTHAAYFKKAIMREVGEGTYVGLPNGAKTSVYYLPNKSQSIFAGIDLRDIAKVMGIIQENGGKRIEVNIKP